MRYETQEELAILFRETKQYSADELLDYLDAQLHCFENQKKAIESNSNVLMLKYEDTTVLKNFIDYINFLWNYVFELKRLNLCSTYRVRDSGGYFQVFRKFEGDAMYFLPVYSTSSHTWEPVCKSRESCTFWRDIRFKENIDADIAIKSNLEEIMSECDRLNKKYSATEETSYF